MLRARLLVSATMVVLTGLVAAACSGSPAPGAGVERAPRLGPGRTQCAPAR